MLQRFIRIAELASSPTRAGRLPVSAATIWRWRSLGLFPLPVKIGPGVTAWRLEDVEAWEAAHSVAGATAESAVAVPTRPLPKRLAPVSAAAAPVPAAAPVKRGRGRPRKILPAAAAA